MEWWLMGCGVFDCLIVDLNLYCENLVKNWIGIFKDMLMSGLVLLFCEV